jgi:phage shock protein C
MDHSRGASSVLEADLPLLTSHSAPMTTMTSQLRRSRTDRMIAGVCGGIAETFGWDATLVRALYVILSAVSAAFPGIVVYIVLALVIPEREA